jgi:hypothetical protein
LRAMFWPTTSFHKLQANFKAFIVKQLNRTW